MKKLILLVALCILPGTASAMDTDLDRALAAPTTTTLPAAVSNLVVTPGPDGLTFTADVAPGEVFNRTFRLTVAIDNLAAGADGYWELVALTPERQWCSGATRLTVYGGLNGSSLFIVSNDIEVTTTGSTLSFTLPLDLFGGTLLARYNFKEAPFVHPPGAPLYCGEGTTAFWRIGSAFMAQFTRPWVQWSR